MEEWNVRTGLKLGDLSTPLVCEWKHQGEGTCPRWFAIPLPEISFTGKAACLPGLGFVDI